MKKIEPITIWYNGKQEIVDVLSLNTNYDNLQNEASFTFNLMQTNSPYMSGSLLSLTSGNLIMNGETYDNWHENEYAYIWAAQQLNVVIIGDY